jgi:hypothetical protein
VEGPSGVGEGNRTRAASHKKAQEGGSAGGGTRDTLAAEERRGRLLPNHREAEAAQAVALSCPTTELESFDPVF